MAESEGVSGAGDREQGAGVELARLLTILKRALFNWKPSAFLVAIGLIAGVAFAAARQPNFKSETIVIYRQGVRLGDERGGLSLTLGARLKEMLLARSRLEGLIDELQLYQNVKAKQGVVEAIEQFRKDISFNPRSTDTFSIAYRGPNPETVQKVTERLALTLIQENQRLRVEQAKVRTEFLAAEKTRTEVELKDKERALAQFLSEHPEFALDQNASNSGVAVRARERASSAKDGARDASLEALRRQSLRLEAAISGETSVYALSDGPADPEAEAARQQAEGALASARSNLASKRASFTDDHPDVKAAKARVAEAEAALKSAEEKVAASRLTGTKAAPGTDAESAKQKLREKKRKIDAEVAAREKTSKGEEKPEQPTEEATSIVGLETSWTRLSRDVSEARDQMTELERNFFRAQIEASSSLGGYSDQVVVLDPAFLPTRPEPPGKTLIVIIAGAASFMLAMVVALLRALLDRRIYEEADLSRIAPVLAVIPRAGRRGWFRR